MAPTVSERIRRLATWKPDSPWFAEVEDIAREDQLRSDGLTGGDGLPREPEGLAISKYAQRAVWPKVNV